MAEEGEVSDGDASDEEPVKKNHLRFTSALTEVPNGDAEAATELNLNGRGITSVDSLESFKNLKKLELKDNHIASLGFLEMNHSLCWLNAGKNLLRRISSLQNLSSLAVLDVSDNKITSLDGLQSLKALKALIAARNRIVRMDGISPKRNPMLETLVLSHNRLEACSVTGFENLKKLSLGHNKLHAFPALKKLPSLAELRLNANQLTSVSTAVASLPRLSNLDVGNNLIETAAGFEPLRGLLWLKSLNILGNSAVAAPGEDQPADIQDILGAIPKLEILNGKRQTGKAKKKRREDAGGPGKERLGGKGRGRGGGRGRGCSQPEDEESEEVKPMRGSGQSRGRGNPPRAATKAETKPGTSTEKDTKKKKNMKKTPDLPSIAKKKMKKGTKSSSPSSVAPKKRKLTAKSVKSMKRKVP